MAGEEGADGGALDDMPAAVAAAAAMSVSSSGAATFAVGTGLVLIESTCALETRRTGTVVAPNGVVATVKVMRMVAPSWNTLPILISELSQS